MTDKRITVLLYPEEAEPDLVVAHCLDYDIVGVGASHEEAIDEMLGCVKAHAEFLVDHPDALPPEPAPQEFWDALKTAEQVPIDKPAILDQVRLARRFVLEATPPGC